jgi:SWI/SNF-related matrix-associated actin-dependent regulator 1 of chromatin subfamily A
MKATTDNGMILLEFDYRKHLVLLMHRLRGEFDRDARVWRVQDSPRARMMIHAAGFHGVEAPPLNSAPFAVPRKPSLRNLDLPHAKQLRPYQRQGVAQIEAFKGRCLLADEMGLGKTIQALEWLALHPDLRPAVVVCPSSIKWNWKREASIWLPGERCAVLDGTDARPPRVCPPLIVISYDVLGKWVGTLREQSPLVVLLDESHRIKNPAAKRSKAVANLCAGVKHVLCITGTPVLQRPEELWTTLRLLRPDVFRSWWDFGVRYCGPQENRFKGGLDFKGSTNAAELNTLLSASCMVRRLKKDVLKDLPAKTRTVVPLDMDAASRKEYADAIERWDAEYAAAVERGDARGVGAIAFRKFAELFGIIAERSMPAKAEWILEWLEDCDGKLIVFGHRHVMLHGLRDAIGAERCVLVDGACKDRQAACERFERDPTCRVLLGEFTAAGVGLNLTAASNVAFAELPWTPAEVEQAEDRAHRIGQVNPVNVWLLITRGTREEAVLGVLQAKRSVVGAVADGDATAVLGVLRRLHSARR